MANETVASISIDKIRSVVLIMEQKYSKCLLLSYLLLKKPRQYGSIPYTYIGKFLINLGNLIFQEILGERLLVNSVTN